MNISKRTIQESRHALAELVLAAISRLLATPLTWLVPRSGNRYVVIAREQGKYLDNCKYFHAWLAGNIPQGFELYFLGERGNVLEKLSSMDYGVVRYPGLRAMVCLLRTGTVVCDASDFIEHGRLGLLSGARIMQLWHGTPLKEIERPLHARRLSNAGWLARYLIAFQKLVLGRYRSVDVLVATSEYVADHALAPCFSANRVISAGYPRNDVIVGNEDYPADLVDFNVDSAAASKVSGHRARGGKVILYAPTFRDSRSSPFDCFMPPERLSDFAQDRNVLIAMKLHPLMFGQYELDSYPGLINVSADSDIYPLLREVDVLVTDYSSLYFDYLLLDRPIVFYPYDHEDYVTRERHLLFDYGEMTPGPKVYDMEDLMAALSEVLAEDNDGWMGERARVRALVHDHVDGCASRRLWQALRAE